MLHASLETEIFNILLKVREQTSFSNKIKQMALNLDMFYFINFFFWTYIVIGNRIILSKECKQGQTYQKYGLIKRFQKTNVVICPTIF